MGFDLDKSYEMLAENRERFLRKDAQGRPVDNFVRVRVTGGTENRYQELEGATEVRTEFAATVWTSEVEEDDSAGVSMLVGDLALHYGPEDLLERGDRVERLSDGQSFKVVKIDDLGGPSNELGKVAHLKRQHD